jgi:hypothetical protein
MKQPRHLSHKGAPQAEVGLTAGLSSVFVYALFIAFECPLHAFFTANL